MAKGDNTNNPNLRLTPVPSVNGGTVNRLVQVNSEPDDGVIGRPAAGPIAGQPTVTLPDGSWRLAAFEHPLASPADHVVGTDDEFEAKYVELPAPSGESLWSETEIEGVDPARVWTVLDGNVIVPGQHYVNRISGPDSYIVTERPWADGNEEFWWGQSDDDRYGELVSDALNKDLHETTRVYQAREAIEVSDFEWDGYEDLDSDEETQLQAAIEDDEKLLAAVDSLSTLTPEQVPQFGVLLSERVWQHERMSAFADQILDTSAPRDNRVHAAQNAIELNDYTWDGYDKLNGDEGLEFDDLVANRQRVIAAIDGLGEVTPEQKRDIGGLLAAELWKNSQE